MYVCGITVYDHCHLGHARSMVGFDVILRFLRAQGYEVTFVRNITDIDDKIITRAQERGVSLTELTDQFIASMHADTQALGVLSPDLEPRATQHIGSVTRLIQRLIDKEFAYLGDNGDVYYHVERFKEYGKLSHKDLDGLVSGARVEVVKEKQSPLDFVLWKKAKHGEPSWPSPWGDGFPGWHIECSAMSLHYLGSHVDLHIGGIDLRFPHHENERAQSNSAMENQEVVDLWLHGEHLLFEGRKMSKSAGNVVLVSDLISRGLNPLALRLTFLENRYRSQMNLTWDSLKAADSTITRWREKYQDWAKAPIAAADEEISEAFAFILSDLESPKTILYLREIEKSDMEPGKKATIFKALDQVLALDITVAPTRTELSSEVEAMIVARAKARAEKNFAESDRLRDELLRLGVDVRDSSL